MIVNQGGRPYPMLKLQNGAMKMFLQLDRHSSAFENNKCWVEARNPFLRAKIGDFDRKYPVSSIKSASVR
jgi:hypothetical protein